MGTLHRLLRVSIATMLIFLAFKADARTVGGCRFDPATEKFSGSIAEQLTCLLRKVRPRGSGSDRQEIPVWLVQHAGGSISITPGQVRDYLRAENIRPEDLGGQIVAGDVPNLQYFVIHDTSWPELTGVTAFPSNINESTFSGNNLNMWSSLATRVHLIISRDGRSRTLQDWSANRARPATKIEQNGFAPLARRVFAHVENVQPRIKPAGSWGWVAPQPGFGPAQEQRLAVSYIVASLRAGRWLIPAYHFNIDQGIPDGHDDPQNADLAGWVARIEAIVERMSQNPK